MTYPQGAYFLSTALVNLADADRLRTTLLGLRAGRNIRVHWRVEQPSRKPELSEAVAKLDKVGFLIVIGTPLIQSEPNEPVGTVCSD